MVTGWASLQATIWWLARYACTLPRAPLGSLPGYRMHQKRLTCPKGAPSMRLVLVSLMILGITPSQEPAYRTLLGSFASIFEFTTLPKMLPHVFGLKTSA